MKCSKYCSTWKIPHHLLKHCKYEMNTYLFSGGARFNHKISICSQKHFVTILKPFTILYYILILKSSHFNHKLRDIEGDSPDI